MPLPTPHQTSVKAVARFLLLLGMTTALAACGQRGPLVAPTANTTTQTEIPEPRTDQSIFKSETENKSKVKVPEDGFILDPLL